MVSIHLCYCPDLPQTRLISPPNIVPTTLSSNSSFPSNLSAKPDLVELPKPIAPTLSAKPTPGQILAPVRSSAELSKPGLKIGIIGFGNFGQFLARAFVRQGHYVLATSRSDYSEYCQRHGIEFFGNVDEMCGEQPDIVLICTSILSTENVVRGIPFHKLKPNTIFVDVLSVKQFPMNLFLEVLPPEFGIVCTHPMFGPESGKHGWEGLSFVYDEVRVANNHQYQKCSQFLRIFEREGCRMVKMACDEHDRHAAGSQFITHTIGRILSHLELESTPINTKGYETLLQLTENTVSDSFDLYYGLFMYNVNATEQIENLDRAFETVKQKLFGRLHDILRKQIVERVPLQPPPKTSSDTNTCHFLPRNEDMKDISSFAIAPSSLKEETHGGPLPLRENATVGGR